MKTGNQANSKPTKKPPLIGQSNFDRSGFFVPDNKPFHPKASTIILSIVFAIVLIFAGYLGYRCYREGPGFLAKIFHGSDAELEDSAEKTEKLICQRDYASSELIAAGNARTGETVITIEYKDRKPHTITRQTSFHYDNSAAVRAGLDHFNNHHRSTLEQLTSSHKNPFDTSTDRKNTSFIVTNTINAKKLSAPLHTFFELPDPKNLEITHLRRHYTNLQQKYTCHRSRQPR